MPYIKQEDRKKFDDCLNNLPVINGPGELNYLITKICIAYFKLTPKGGNYQTINDVTGALHCAAQEFYRKLVGNYEDLKAQANGDVYAENE